MMQLSAVPVCDMSSPTTSKPHFNLSAAPHNKTAKYRISFETIVRLYYLRHGFKMPDMMMTLFLSSLAFKSVDKLKTCFSVPRDLRPQSSLEALSNPVTDEIRSTLILAQKGLTDQGQSYYLPQTVAHLVLANVDEEEAGIIRNYVDGAMEDADARQLRAEHIEAHFPVNLRSFTESTEQQRMNNLMQEYAGMTTG